MTHVATSAAPARDWQRIALLLVSATLVYNVIEAVIALWAAGVSDSIALLGFGLDSVIETVAAVALLWRLGVEARGASAELVAQTELRVVRIVGATFLVLAAYVAAQSVWVLATGAVPSESWVGIGLAALSLVLMPLVSLGKLRAADEIGSAALRAEAKETLACSYLSFTLLVGLVVHATTGIAWIDPVTALLMVPWLVKEGREGLRGETCCD